MSVTTSLLWQRILEARRRGRLAPAVYARLKPWLSGAKYLLYNPVRKTVRLHLPKFVMPDKAETVTVRRIFEAFKRMKADGHSIPTCYQPSSLWRWPSYH